MKFRILALAALVMGLAFTPFAKADSVIFESQSGNNYTYDLQIDNHGALFLLDGFTITGLSGVTDATLSGKLADLFNPLGGVAFDSNDVAVGTLFGVTVSRKDIYSIGTLTITSAALPGLANFFIQDSNGQFCGTVVGPTGGDPSPVPEPSSIVLLGSGLLAAAGATRRKLFA
jgi:hypothetical protein